MSLLDVQDSSQTRSHQSSSLSHPYGSMQYKIIPQVQISNHHSKDSDLPTFVLPTDCIVVERPAQPGPRATTHRGV